MLVRILWVIYKRIKKEYNFLYPFLFLSIELSVDIRTSCFYRLYYHCQFRTHTVVFPHLSFALNVTDSAL